MNLVDLIAPLTVEPATVPVSLPNGDIAVTYDRRALTGRWFALLVTRPRRALAEALLTWDVTTSTGAPYAPPPLDTPEWRQEDDAGPDVARTRYADAWELLLEPLPIAQVIQPIAEAIADDWRAGPKAAAASPAS